MRASCLRISTRGRSKLDVIIAGILSKRRIATGSTLGAQIMLLATANMNV